MKFGGTKLNDSTSLMVAELQYRRKARLRVVFEAYVYNSDEKQSFWEDSKS